MNELAPDGLTKVTKDQLIGVAQKYCDDSFVVSVQAFASPLCMHVSLFSQHPAECFQL